MSRAPELLEFAEVRIPAQRSFLSRHTPRCCGASVLNAAGGVLELLHGSTVGGQVSPQRFRAVLAKVTEWVWVFSELGALATLGLHFALFGKFSLIHFRRNRRSLRGRGVPTRNDRVAHLPAALLVQSVLKVIHSRMACLRHSLDKRQLLCELRKVALECWHYENLWNRKC